MVWNVFLRTGVLPIVRPHQRKWLNIGLKQTALPNLSKTTNTYSLQRTISVSYTHLDVYKRQVPLYQLFRLYEKNGRTNEAMRTAKAIIEMPVKVQSNVVERIRSAAKAFLSETDAEKPTE